MIQTYIHASDAIAPADMAFYAVTYDYDCDCDCDGFFSTDPVGYGRTKAEALSDLLEQIREG